MLHFSSRNRPGILFVAMFGALALAACSPAAAAPTPIPRAPTLTPTPLPSPAPMVRATAESQSLAGVDVSVVEPPFRPPQEWKFAPDTIRVKVGTRIAWTNTGAVLHTVTADDSRTFDSGDLQPQATFSFTPASPGTLAYHCNLHPWMKGTITVAP